MSLENTDIKPHFGPPLFHRIMRKVHPQNGNHLIEGSSFKIMSYNITSDRVLETSSSHLLEDDLCHNPIYRMNRIMSEIE